MIQVDFLTSQGLIVGFVTSGHADLEGPEGSMVCTAVSALTLATANGLEGVCGLKQDEMEAQAEDGFLSLQISSLARAQESEVQALLETLKLGLENIQGQFSKYIKIQSQEV